MIIMYGLLAFIVPALIITVIILAIVKNSKKDNEDSESFEKIMRTLYVYSIMVITLIMLITSGVQTFNSILNIALPIEYNDSSFETRTLISNLVLFLISMYFFVKHSKIAKEIKDEEKILVKEPIKTEEK